MAIDLRTSVGTSPSISLRSTALPWKEAKKAEKKAWKKLKKNKLGRPKLRSYKNLRKQAWNLQSVWVRQNERGICFTCGDKRDWKEQQAGHFIHRDCLDFDLRNIHCQCVKCNKYLSGNEIEYTLKMIEKYGKETVEELKALSYITRKFRRDELEDMIAIYKKD